MSVDVSVVVPVFNSEKYLPQCINSLIRQSLKNVEFIFVDDGSTDHSVDIIEAFQKRDERIRLIRQKNQYAGVARNNGMKVATGKYIIFLDSDDFFELSLLEEAFDCAEKNRAEITMFWYSVIDNATQKIIDVPYPPLPVGVIHLEDIGERFYEYYPAAPWNKLFLRSFVEKNNLAFQPVRKCNDTYFTHMAALLSARIVFLKRRLVFYRSGNPESIQGKENFCRESYVDCETAIRAKMIELGLFSGEYKKAYLYYVKKLIHYHASMTDAQMDSIGQYYDRTKNALVPGLFDSVEEFVDDRFIMNIYEGSFESFLLYQARDLAEQVRELQGTTVSKNSKDYRIGHAVLALPRAVYHALGLHNAD